VELDAADQAQQRAEGSLAADADRVHRSRGGHADLTNEATQGSIRASPEEVFMSSRYWVVAVGLLACLVCAPSAHAAARVFVSVNGTDTGDCSNVNAPCRTLNFAIAAVDAGGEVIVTATGSYGGATVTKSVRIDVPPGLVAFSASPIVVNAGGSDVVVIRGLTLKALTPGTGQGVQFNNALALFVENCVIDGWADGIAVNVAASLFVTGTTVRNCGTNGIVVGGTVAEVTVEKSRLEANTFSGLNAFGGFVSVRDSVVSGNGTIVNGGGLLAQGGELDVESTLISSNNTVGVSAGGQGSIARVSHCAIVRNGTGLSNNGAGAVIERFGNNMLRGNGTETAGTITFVALQ
jgi:hypothetical protein